MSFIKRFRLIELGLIMTILTGSDKSTLFTNVNIYSYPEADALLVKNGKIEEIGKFGDLSGDQIIDLNNGYLYPGFTDGHMHLLGYGYALENLDLTGTESKNQILKIISETASKLSAGAWIVGRGWDQNDWDIKLFPDKNDLDLAAPHNPVVLSRIDGHAVWVNSQVLMLAGITSQTPSPSGGKIHHNKYGEPTGILVDNAQDLLRELKPSPTRADKRRLILRAQDKLNSFGLTSIHDAGTDAETIEILDELYQSGLLTMRINCILNDSPDDYESFLENGPKTGNPYYQVRALKLYLDGALGSRGAALLEPYTDDPENTGLILTDSAQVAKTVKLFNERGFQVAIHCIGDRANRIALDIFEKTGRIDYRNRIEHAQIIHEQDIARFSKLGVLPCIQATHCTSDMYWAETRLGPDRLKGAYPWQSLISSGSILPGGSDAPVESPAPLFGIFAALTRRDSAGWPAGGWQSQERLSLNQAIKMVTEWPAFASFEENIKGRLSPGYYADFTVLDDALDEVNPDNILNINIKFTIVNGEIVFNGEKE